jgi:hypothetical protein
LPAIVGARSVTSGQTAPAARTPSRKLARLGCLLPILSTAFFLLVLFAWPNERHRPASDLQTMLFFVSLGLVPISAVAAIVLAVMAFIRAGHEPTRSSRLAPVLTIIVAIACVALMVGLIWLLLVAAGRFR